MTRTFHSALTWILRGTLAAVFLYAAVPKIWDPAGFAHSINNYQLLPDAMINPLAIYLPWLELLTAVAVLAIPACRRGAWILFGLMLAVFIAAISAAMARGINIDCGCFSTTGHGMRAGTGHLILDAVLLAAVLAAWILECRPPTAATGR